VNSGSGNQALHCIPTCKLRQISVVFSVNTEIRFIDVDPLEVWKDFLKVELFELVKQEGEAVLMQLGVYPANLVHLQVHHNVTYNKGTVNP